VRIADLIPDRRNANKGTKRGHSAVAHSLKELGAGRSILIDRAGRIIAGTKTAANAAAAGIEDVVVVQTDGSQIVAVQRTDLDLENDPKAKALAVADNRTAELGLEWDPAVLGELSGDLDLKPFFTDEELAKELGQPGEDSAPLPPAGYGVLVENLTEQQQVALLERLSAEGFSVKAMTF